MEFTSILIKTSYELDISQDDILREIGNLEWHDMPIKNIPLMQDYGIKRILKEFRIHAKCIAWNGIIKNHYALLGVETDKQCLYFLDMGDHICPIGLENR